MHDAKGRELKIGDLVLIPCVVLSTHASEEFCNVHVESIYGRRPDGAKEHLHSFNTGVMLRANQGDTNDWPELRAITAA